MAARRVMILAGTQEARELANAVVAAGVDVLSSFAGVTQMPKLPNGLVRTGGFGGVAGLVAHLKAEGITTLVDATHPYAAQMSAHAAEAALELGIEIVRLQRPAWLPGDGAGWIDVPTLADAPSKVPHGARLLLTTGRKGLNGFFARPDITGLIRTIEPPDEALPAGWTLLLDRPPHSLSRETALMQREGITCLVSKNAGGDATFAKIASARHLGLAVVMVMRPWKPAVTTFNTVFDVVRHLGLGRA